MKKLLIEAIKNEKWCNINNKRNKTINNVIGIAQANLEAKAIKQIQGNQSE